jgi:hemoglobin
MTLSIRSIVLPAVLAAVLAACQPQPAPALYDRLGGRPAIVAVVDEFVTNVVADAAINKRFQGTNAPKLKALLVDQVCEAAGGPCKYQGRDMKTTHKGMDLSDGDFDAMAGDMVKALDKFRVPTREKGEVMALLGSMRRDIVGQ